MAGRSMKRRLAIAVLAVSIAGLRVEGADARLIRRWQAFADGATVVSISPDGRSLVSSSGHTGAGVTLWNIDGSGSRRLAERGGYDVTFSPDGSHVLFVTGRANKAILFDLGTDAVAHEFDFNGGVWTAVFSPDGRWIVTGSETPVDGREENVGVIHVWDADTRVLQRMIEIGGQRVTKVRFSPGADYCFIIDAYFANGPTFREGSMWSAATWEPVYRFGRDERYFGIIGVFDFSPTDPHYAVAPALNEQKGGVDVLDVENGRIIIDTHKPELSGQRVSPERIKYFPNGTLMAMAAREDVWLYDLESREVVCMFPFVGENPDDESVKSLAVSPDGRCLAIGKTNGYSELWDVSAFTGAGIGEEWSGYE